MSWVKNTFFGGASGDASQAQVRSLEKAMDYQREASDQARSDVINLFGPGYGEMMSGYQSAQDQIASGFTDTSNIYKQASQQADTSMRQGSQASINALLGRNAFQGQSAPTASPGDPAQYNISQNIPRASSSQSGLRATQSSIPVSGLGNSQFSAGPVSRESAFYRSQNSSPMMGATSGLQKQAINETGAPVMPGTAVPGSGSPTPINDSQMLEDAVQQTPINPVNINAPNMNPQQNIQQPDVSGIGLSGAEAAIQQGVDKQTGSVTEGYQAGIGEMQPYADTGEQALQKEAALSGALGAEAQQQAIDGFMESPGQKYLREQAEKSLLRNASATGGLRGGSTLAALQEQAVGLSAQQQQQQLENMRSLAGRGQQASGNIAGMQVGQGQDLSNIYGQQANQLSGLRWGAGQQVAQQMSGLGQSLGQNQLNLGSQLGGLTQGTTNNLAQLQQGQGEQGFNSRMQLAQLLSNIASGQGTNMAALQSRIGQAQAGGATGSAAGAQQGIGNVVGLISQFMSDERLKENIQPIMRENGIGFYSYTWAHNEAIPEDLRGKQSFGAMAHEVKDKHPDCVIEHNGYLAIDYGKLAGKVRHDH